MKCERKILVEGMPGLYAVTAVTLNGSEYYMAASENHEGQVVMADPRTGAITPLKGGQGGVMAILDLKDENAVLFIEEFYPVFDSATAKVIKATLTLDGENWQVTGRQVLAEIPYVHRISLLKERDGVYLAAGKLCKHKDNPDDWSTSGTVEIGKYDPDSDHVVMKQIYDGIMKHHAMYVAKNEDGFDDLYFGGTEGVFCAKKKSGEWETEQLLNVPTSDIVYMDLDGDGEKELVIIEEFHGNKAVLFKKIQGKEERLIEIPLEFGHVLWGGSFLGEPALITGSRAGDKSLRKFTFTADKDGRTKIQTQEVLDEGQAPAQIFVTGDEQKTIVVAANHGVAQMAEYSCTK